MLYRHTQCPPVPPTYFPTCLFAYSSVPPPSPHLTPHLYSSLRGARCPMFAGDALFPKGMSCSPWPLPFSLPVSTCPPIPSPVPLPAPHLHTCPPPTYSHIPPVPQPAPHVSPHLPPPSPYLPPSVPNLSSLSPHLFPTWPPTCLPQ